jgi:hypothetical protein
MGLMGFDDEYGAVQAGRDVPVKRDRAAEIEAAKQTGPKMLS